MISPATITNLRCLLEDIEQGRCRAPLDRPTLRTSLQAALDLYERNHAQYQNLAKMMERLDGCIEREPESEGAARIVPRRKTAVYHSALFALRRFLAAAP